MCVAAPARVIEIDDRAAFSIPATVEIGTVRQTVDLVMVPEAVVGDTVIIHSGYAVSLVDPDDARTRLEWLGLD